MTNEFGEMSERGPRWKRASEWRHGEQTLCDQASVSSCSGKSAAGATLIARPVGGVGREHSHWDIPAEVAADDYFALEVEDEDRGCRHPRLS